MDENRVLSLNLFLNMMKESCDNEKRYCFILGAGASKTSGIPTGEEMARLWHDELVAKTTPEEIQDLKRRLKVRSITPSSKNYFGLYALRFFPHYSNGSAYLERTLEQAQPSLGYYPLASLLASKKYSNNLVITTNFDSLVEDALFIYTEKKPLVINHELLTDYINFNTKRPIVAKLHRGLFFDPFNRAEQVSKLSDAWKKVLQEAFKAYTPVVIGYAGGDHSLMSFLSDEAELDGLYWCYRHDEPSEEIQALVTKHNGYFVPIEGFDEMMYLMGLKFGYGNPCERIQSVARQRVDDYNKQVQELKQKLSTVSAPSEVQSQILDSLSREQADELRKLNDRIIDDPEDAEAYEARGRIFYSAKEFDNAIEDFTKVIELGCGRHNTYWYRGYSYRQKGMTEEGFQDYTKSLELQETAIAYNNRGAIYSDKKEYKNAIADFERAIELGPDCSLYHNNCAWAYYRLEQYDRVLEHCARAVSLGNPTANTYKYQGDAFWKKEEYKKALDSYNEALRRNPGSDEAINGLGLAYEGLGQDKRALAEYRRAAKMDPSEPAYHANEAGMLRRAGRFKEAVTSCNRAIKANPKYRRAYWIRSKAYEGQGQTAKAERDMETYKAMEED